MSLISAAYALKEVMGGGSFAMPSPQNVPVQQQQPPTLSAGGFEQPPPKGNANDIPQSAEPAYQAMRVSAVPPVVEGIPSDQQTTQKTSEWPEPIAISDESPRAQCPRWRPRMSSSVPRNQSPASLQPRPPEQRHDQTKIDLPPKRNPKKNTNRLTGH
jgi:hypothetical protein